MPELHMEVELSEDTLGCIEEEVRQLFSHFCVDYFFFTS